MGSETQGRATHPTPLEWQAIAPESSGVLPLPVDTLSAQLDGKRRQAMAQALRSLSVEHREVIVLRFYVDLTPTVKKGNGLLGGTSARSPYAFR